MRLAGQEKLGFYPAPLEAIDMIAQKVTADPQAVIVDPCAGEGEAVAALADRLGLDHSRIVASELEVNRSEALAARLPTARVSKATDFQSSYVPRDLATVVYLNPPFDSEIGHLGSRCEETFLARATNMLAPDGVLVFILPEHRLPAVRLFLHNWYHSCNKLLFPKDARRFSEVAVLAVKRKKALADRNYPYNFLDAAYIPAFYHAGAGRLFDIEKRGYTDQELERLMKIDPLLSEAGCSSVSQLEKIRPPLTLGLGHVALLLAAGHLNGRVAKAGEPPHVVRGTSRKVEFEKSKTVAGSDTTVVTQERIELVIRKVDQTGVIEELQNA
jgi:hypothetical protein